MLIHAKGLGISWLRLLARRPTRRHLPTVDPMIDTISLLKPEQVDITSVLAHRTAREPDYESQKRAVGELLQLASERPNELLARFVALGREFCGAESAGISLYESDPQSAGVFRWHYLSGTLAPFTGATTPRDFSPCGICLDQSRPILMAHPEQAYGWIRDANITVPEVLLVPLQVGRDGPIGTLWVVASQGTSFDVEHVRILRELAGVASVATELFRLSTAHERASNTSPSPA
jgi:GAF domain-containing protein